MIVLRVSIVALLLLLFVGNPKSIDNRVLSHIWDMGHVVLFSLMAFAFMRTKYAQKNTHWIMLIVVVLFSFIFGFATELIQSSIGRTFSWNDLINDLIGGMLGYSAAMTLVHSSKSNKKSHLIFPVITLVLLLFGSRNLIVSIIDEHNRKSIFPTLSNFEGPFEESRWKSSYSRLSISDKKKHEGQHSLKMDFLPAKYSTVSLLFLEKNWSSYQFLKFSLFNSELRSLNVVAKIYDEEHTHSYNHNDRFNRTLTLTPGWNEIVIPIDNVRLGPIYRELNLTEIKSFSLFVIGLEKPASIHLDNLRLTVE